MRVRLLMIAAMSSLVVAGCIRGTGYAANPREFDARQWKAAVGDDRCEMVDDLRERVGLQGKSRDELIDLLGEPESHSEAASDHYHLCPSFMDVWILEIEWEKGRVASTRVRDT